jgi:hypothetical protein
MSQNLNIVPAIDGRNYSYWKARICFFLKSIDCWQIVEPSWTKPKDATLELIPARNAQLASDKALYALCQALSPSKFAKNLNYEIAQEARQILETTYEGTKLVKYAKLQMLISRFEEIRMLEDKTFREFYTQMSDLRNSMVSLRKTISDVKLIQKILRSLPERFRIKVTTIEESKDLKEIKNENWWDLFKLMSFPYLQSRRSRLLPSRHPRKKVRVSFEEDFDNEEDVVTMLAKNFGRLMKNDKFKKKFSERLEKAPKESEPEEAKKKDPRGLKCFECSSFGHIRADYGNLKQGKGKAYNATLSG